MSANPLLSELIKVKAIQAMYDRLEVIVTILMDGAMIAVALIVQATLTWLIRALGNPGETTWALRVLHFILDCGLVGTVAILVAFDLGKRIRLGWRAFTLKTGPIRPGGDNGQS